MIATTSIFTFWIIKFYSFVKFQFCFIFVCLFSLFSKSTKLLFRVYYFYRNTLLGNTIIIIQQIYWKSGHMKETVHKTVMLIKFSKKISTSFAKIISGYKGQFKTLSNIWAGAFSMKSLLTSKANSEFCQTSKMKLFAKIVKN